MEPRPAQPLGPPIWVGSWGSDAGLRRVGASRRRLARIGVQHDAGAVRRRVASTSLRSCPITGRTADTFPNALATMWCYITDDRAEADRVLKERVDSHRAPTRGDAPRASPDRARRTVRREVDRVRATQACNASSSGRSPTRCTSSSASGTKCDPRSQHVARSNTSHLRRISPQDQAWSSRRRGAPTQRGPAPGRLHSPNERLNQPRQNCQ